MTEAKKKVAKKEEGALTERTKYVSIVPAPAGMNAFYTGNNPDGNPVTGVRQVVALGLGEDGYVHVITLDDVNLTNEGKPLLNNEDLTFSHVTI
jgi:hypothetical protein